MEQSLLLCLAGSGEPEKIAALVQEAGFRVEKRGSIPRLEEFDEVLPDWFLLDFDFVKNSPSSSLKKISDQFPSVKICLLAGSEEAEQTLFSCLKAGARGWIFKEKPEKIAEDLSKLAREKKFFQPRVSHMILQEFKKFPEGETLLPLEEEILRQNACSVGIKQIEQNLGLSTRTVQAGWESIWQKLNINARAQEQIQRAAPAAPLPPPKAPERSGAGADAYSFKPENFPAENRQLVVFALGAQEFAFDIGDLHEIQRMMPLTPLPRVSRFVLGIANVRGTIVPVIDLRLKLHLKATPFTKDTRVVLASVDEKLVGIVVDSVKEVLRLPSLREEPPPALLHSPVLESVKSVLNLQDRLILLLDLKKILSENAGQPEQQLQLAGG